MLRNLNTRLRSASMVGVLALALGMVGSMAHATDAPTVPTVDYATSAGTVITSVGATVASLFPYLAVLIALFAGIAIFRRMIKSGAKG